MAKINRIDHIAVLVDDIDAAEIFWQQVLGIEVTECRYTPQEQATVAFLPVGGSKIELVQPLDGDSGLRRFLEKRGAGMHHLCLEVDDIEGMIAQLKANGAEMINEQPKIGEGGKRYVFIHPRSTGGVLVEMYEE